MRKNNDGKVLYIIIVLIVIALIGGGVYLALNNNENITTSGSIFTKSLKDEVVTAENYEEIKQKMENELKEDELYYASYAMLTYITQDGLTNLLNIEEDDSAMYVRIYGKTVKQLIDEGKQLMKENDMTIEKYKESLEQMNNAE